MYERIVDIIVYVMSELRSKKDIKKVNLDELQSRGYTSSEISTALSWIADRIAFNERVLPFGVKSEPHSFRVLQESEKELFTPDAWGELVSMNNLGIISNENIETLIDKAMLIGMYKIDLKELKIFVANSIFFMQYDNIGGSRFMLQGNDTIN